MAATTGPIGAWSCLAVVQEGVDCCYLGSSVLCFSTGKKLGEEEVVKIQGSGAAVTDQVVKWRAGTHVVLGSLSRALTVSY